MNLIRNSNSIVVLNQFNLKLTGPYEYKTNNLRINFTKYLIVMDWKCLSLNNKRVKLILPS